MRRALACPRQAARLSGTALTEGTLIGPLVAPLVEAAASRGAPVAALLGALGATREELMDPDYRVPASRVFAAWEVAIDATDDPTLTIAVGRQASIQRFGMLGYAVYTSDTVADAIAALSRYHLLINDSGTWTVEASADSAVVTWNRGGEPVRGRQLANEQAVASFIEIGRETAEGALEVLEVWLERDPPASEAAHRSYFCERIHWGSAKSAVRLSPASLSHKPRGANKILAEHFLAQADAAIARVGKRDSWMARTAKVISERLPSGIPTSTTIARVLQVSERTLRRRLQEEGTGFAELVTSVQRERARDLLASGTAVRDAAFAAGFADATAFSRAYRRWTGKAPSSARRPGR
jgi:AraC-like DNA-binding protein